MQQSRKMSFTESAINMAASAFISIYAQTIIYPWFEIYVSLTVNIVITLSLTGIGLLRNYVIRRWFNKKVKTGKQQSTMESWVESITNTAVGYFIALTIQLILFPLFNVDITIKTALEIVLIFTIISIVRGFVFRRIFNWIDSNKELIVNSKLWRSIWRSTEKS